MCVDEEACGGAAGCEASLAGVAATGDGVGAPTDCYQRTLILVYSSYSRLALRLLVWELAPPQEEHLARQTPFRLQIWCLHTLS